MRTNETVNYEEIFPAEPDAIFDLSITIVNDVYSALKDREEKLLKDAFWDTVRLFKGEYPGYRECTTVYHDLSHSLSVFLTAVRILHGAVVGGNAINSRTGIIGLVAALFHDVGLIQKADDRDGTGAKYTIGHEERSIDFMRNYLKRKGFDKEYFEDSAHIIGCTMLDIKVSRIPFRDKTVALMGKIVGTADLYTQLADRIYLEKLLYLYREFQEGGVGGFESEYDLLKKTESFYRKIALKRLNEELDGVYRYMKVHFKTKMGIDRDFYMEGIEKNIEYLKNVVLKYKDDYRKMLRRAGIVSSLKES